MPKQAIILVIILSVILTSFLVYETTHALSFNIIGRIISAVRTVASLLQNVDTVRITSPFGGKIADTGRACTIHYWTLYYVAGFPVTHPGVPIPIGGTKIDVGPPGIEAEEIFTFPFISQIYLNNNENQVGAWTLGLIFNNEFFEESVLNPINDALDQIPAFSVGVITFYNFSLSCPDGGVIYKIGTSE